MSNNLKLYEISDKYQFLLHDLYDEETGEIDESVMVKLNELSDSAETKCINIVKIFKEIDYQRLAIAEEKKRMQARETALKNQVERLKFYLQSNMDRCKIDRVECPQFVISMQKNPASLSITNAKLLPEKYMKVTVEPDNEKIKEDLKNNVVIPGACLVQGRSVRIR
jgi:hypothetical protein